MKITINITKEELDALITLDHTLHRLSYEEAVLSGVLLQIKKEGARFLNTGGYTPSSIVDLSKEGE